MHAEIADRRDEIAAVCRRYRVSRLDVFGSAARGTDFDPETSDADFMVDFHPPTLPGIFDRHYGLQEELSDNLGRKVDLIRASAIRNRYLREAIYRSRELVYESRSPGVARKR